MRLLWLPDVLRRAGLTVHEVAGWKTRGDSSFGPVRGIQIHGTGSSRTATTAGDIRVLLNGSQTAPAPIAQLYLARDGGWHVVASGLCFHNLIGEAGPNEGYGNDSILGIEAAHSNGQAEPWPDVQYRSYVRGVAALVRHKVAGYDVTVARVSGHKEHQPGNKVDPTFSMPTFRRDVTAALEEEDMAAKDLLAEDVVPNRPWRSDSKTNKTVRWEWAVTETWDLAHEAAAGAKATAADVKALRAEVAALKDRPPVDAAALQAAVAAALADPAVAAVLAEAYADEQARRLES